MLWLPLCMLGGIIFIEIGSTYLLAEASGHIFCTYSMSNFASSITFLYSKLTHDLCLLTLDERCQLVFLGEIRNDHPRTCFLIMCIIMWSCHVKYSARVFPSVSFSCFLFLVMSQPVIQLSWHVPI